MNLEENIKKAAEMQVMRNPNIHEDLKYSIQEYLDSFIDGAKSQAAKDYWYNEFKLKQVLEPTYLYDKFVEYRKELQAEEISCREKADRISNILNLFF